jgi:hypothetical protein
MATNVNQQSLGNYSIPTFDSYGQPATVTASLIQTTVVETMSVSYTVDIQHSSTGVRCYQTFDTHIEAAMFYNASLFKVGIFVHNLNIKDIVTKELIEAANCIVTNPRRAHQLVQMATNVVQKSTMVVLV